MTKIVSGKKDFDVISLVNQLFPNESALESIDSVRRLLQRRVSRADNRIQENLRLQAKDSATCAAELDNVTKAMQGLCGFIVDVREKSSGAEAVVADITRDIKSLDCAKRNLASAITVLRRLSMMAASINCIAENLPCKRFALVADSLKVLSPLETQFSSFRNVPQVVIQLENLASIRHDIRRQAMDLFDRSFSPLGVLQTSCDSSSLQDACVAIENLDSTSRINLEDWYCNLVLREYRTVFSQKEELSSLANVPRRFAWLRRYLKTYDEQHFKVFPKTWDIDLTVCKRFGLDTRIAINEVIESTPSEPKVMARTMKTVLEFEEALSARYPQEKQYSGISSYFELAMSPGLLEPEECRLNQLLTSFKSLPLQPDESNSSVLASSAQMFLAYREILAAVTKVAKGKLLVDLCGMFAKNLSNYAEFLDDQSRDDRRAASSVEEFRTACILVNTANYCFEVCSQLRDKINEKIVIAEFQGKISLESQSNLFKTSSMAGVKFLVRSIDSACDSVWSGILKTQWGSLERVGDQSEFIGIFSKTLFEIWPVIFSTISEPKMYRTIVDKFAELIPNKLYQCILRSKTISEAGAEQLLLDVYAFKEICLKAPIARNNNDMLPSSIYQKVLERGCSKSEILLKVLLTPALPAQALVDCFANLYPPAEQKRSVFAQILELKGVRKNEAAQLQDMLAVRLPTGTILSPLAGSNRTTTLFDGSGTVAANQVKKIFSFSTMK